MAVILHMTYSKKLGLPNFSSHSCSVSLQVEIADVGQVTGESKRLYALIQDAVDREIQEVGWMPADPAYGLTGSSNGNGHQPHENGQNGNGNHSNGSSNGSRSSRKGVPITDKQLDLIGKVVSENNLDKNDVENMAVEMFGTGVRSLNRMQASNFIDALFEEHGRSKGNGHSNGNRGRYQQRERSRS